MHTHGPMRAASGAWARPGGRTGQSAGLYFLYRKTEENTEPTPKHYEVKVTKYEHLLILVDAY